MKVKWDYTELADAYIKRANYSTEALQALFNIMNLSQNAPVCDIGAGVGHLTIELAEQGYSVTAVEPNDAMRKNGALRTQQFDNVQWFVGTGEETGQSDEAFEACTFGSSFNVCDQQLALAEVSRIIKPQGWFVCMWNHRDLEDVHQKSFENIIKRNLPNYSYGNRREDQTKVLKESNLFQSIQFVTGDLLHTQTAEECVEAWRSHGTLHRHAGDKFYSIIDEIEEYLNSQNLSTIKVPYKTRAWIAQFK